MRSPRVGVYLAPSMRREFDDEVTRLGVRKSEVVRDLLEEWLRLHGQTAAVPGPSVHIEPK